MPPRMPLSTAGFQLATSAGSTRTATSSSSPARTPDHPRRTQPPSVRDRRSPLRSITKIPAEKLASGCATAQDGPFHHRRERNARRCAPAESRRCGRIPEGTGSCANAPVAAVVLNNFSTTIVSRRTMTRCHPAPTITLGRLEAALRLRTLGDSPGPAAGGRA